MTLLSLTTLLTSSDSFFERPKVVLVESFSSIFGWKDESNNLTTFSWRESYSCQVVVVVAAVVVAATSSFWNRKQISDFEIQG